MKLSEIQNATTRSDAHSLRILKDAFLSATVEGFTRQEPDKQISPCDVLEAVANEMGLSALDIKSNCRKGRLVKARRVYICVARMLPYKWSNATISYAINRDHSTVIHHGNGNNGGVGIMEDYRLDTDFRAIVNRCIDKCTCSIVERFDDGEIEIVIRRKKPL